MMCQGRRWRGGGRSHLLGDSSSILLLRLLPVSRVSPATLAHLSPSLLLFSKPDFGLQTQGATKDGEARRLAGDIIPRAWIGMCQGATKDGEAGVWPLNNCGDIIPRAWHVGCVGRSLQVRECRHCYQQTYRAGNGESQPATDSSGGGFDTTNHRHRCLRPLLALLLHCAYRAVNNTVNY